MRENIFELTNPMLYRCSVHRYYSTLSRLYLRLYRGQEQSPALYLLFSDVGYFEGPLTWQGADFRIAPHEDCIQLMLKSGLVGEAILQFPDAYAALTAHVNLYEVRTLASPVRFIAGEGMVMQSLPPELG